MSLLLIFPSVCSTLYFQKKCHSFLHQIHTQKVMRKALRRKYTGICIVLIQKITLGSCITCCGREECTICMYTQKYIVNFISDSFTAMSVSAALLLFFACTQKDTPFLTKIINMYPFIICFMLCETWGSQYLDKIQILP